jgi:hypothetical protein
MMCAGWIQDNAEKGLAEPKRNLTQAMAATEEIESLRISG